MRIPKASTGWVAQINEEELTPDYLCENSNLDPFEIVCLSDFDEQAGYCSEDSPRRDQIAQAQSEQAGAVLKGFANAFGLGDAVKKASEAAQQAQSNMARCPKDGTLAAAGTKFCPECGSPLVQPVSDACPNCGAEVRGTKIERAPAGVRPSCGAYARGAKFCPECGTKLL